jgi:DNA-binding NarL/FixJ family response regulator
MQVLRLLAQGLLNKEIAYELGISMKTVEFHRARVMAALNARSMAELMRVAVDRELIPPADGHETD